MRKHLSLVLLVLIPNIMLASSDGYELDYRECLSQIEILDSNRGFCDSQSTVANIEEAKLAIIAFSMKYPSEFAPHKSLVRRMIPKDNLKTMVLALCGIINKEVSYITINKISGTFALSAACLSVANLLKRNAVFFCEDGTERSIFRNEVRWKEVFQRQLLSYRKNVLREDIREYEQLLLGIAAQYSPAKEQMLEALCE